MKDSRKVAERNLRAIRQKYQPIRNKQKEQEEAVGKFKDAEQVRRGLEGEERKGA